MLEFDVVEFNIKNTDDNRKSEIIYDFNLHHCKNLDKINLVIQRIVDNHNKALIKNKNGEFLVISTNNDDKDIYIYGSLNIYNNYIHIKIQPKLDHLNIIVSIKKNEENKDITKKTKFHKHAISNCKKNEIEIDEKYKNVMNEMLLFICDLFVNRLTELAMLLNENKKFYTNIT